MATTYSNTGQFVTDKEVSALAASSGIPFRQLKAVVDVESSGGGFRKDGFPTILFEPHVFNSVTKSKYLKSHPGLATRNWNATLASGHYNKNQKSVFDKAYALDPDSAVKATSWGLGQILGINYAAAGYSNPGLFMHGMRNSEHDQAVAMIKFINSNPSMKNNLINKNWEGFARAYNGPAYKKNKYDEHLRSAFERAKDFAVEHKAASTGVGTIVIIAIIAFVAYKILSKT